MKTRVAGTVKKRRQPKQSRARQTVEAVLDAAVKILEREGVHAITTNRIAVVAGVSVGSVYQYFPDKGAIFVALHDRHVEQMARLIDRALVEHATASLADFLQALLDGLVEAHAKDPELYELLATQLPHRQESSRPFEEHLRGALRLAITSRETQPRKRRDLERTLFVVVHMVEALSHGAVIRRPASLSLSSAKDEAVRAIVGYLSG